MSNPILEELGLGRADDPRVRTDPRYPLDIREVSEAERVPIGGNRLRLTLPPREGYVRRWFNDVGDRIARARQGGWVHIPTAGVLRVGTGSELGHNDLGSVISQVGGRNEDGSPMRIYAMEIKQEWYDADQEVKRKALRQTEADLRRGFVQAQDGDNSNKYIPEEGISIE